MKSPHWAQLRGEALKRDGHKCVRCSATEFLNGHHKVYREPLEAGVLEDIETLCRECHRAEHGIEFPHFFLLYRAMKLEINWSDMRPSAGAWKRLYCLIQYPWEMQEYGDLLFQFIILLWHFDPDHPRHLEIWFRAKRVQLHFKKRGEWMWAHCTAPLPGEKFTRLSRAPEGAKA